MFEKQVEEKESKVKAESKRAPHVVYPFPRPLFAG